MLDINSEIWLSLDFKITFRNFEFISQKVVYISEFSLFSLNCAFKSYNYFVHLFLPQNKKVTWHFLTNLFLAVVSFYSTIQTFLLRIANLYLNFAFISQFWEPIWKVRFYILQFEIFWVWIVNFLIFICGWNKIPLHFNVLKCILLMKSWIFTMSHDLQKSFEYADFLLKKHFWLLSLLRTVAA